MKILHSLLKNNIYHQTHIISYANTAFDHRKDAYGFARCSAAGDGALDMRALIGFSSNLVMENLKEG